MLKTQHGRVSWNIVHARNSQVSAFQPFESQGVVPLGKAVCVNISCFFALLVKSCALHSTYSIGYFEAAYPQQCMASLLIGLTKNLLSSNAAIMVQFTNTKRSQDVAPE